MRLRKGQLVAVEFIDHVQHSNEPLTFVVYGRLLQVDRRSLVVGCWCYAEPRKKFDHNVDRYTIVRSAITKITHLTDR